MKLSFNKKAKKRIISLTTAFAIITNAFPLGELSGIISPLISLKAKAAEFLPADEISADGLAHFKALTFGASPTYAPTTGAEEFENTANSYVAYNSAANNYTISFGDTSLFIDYCWHYSNTDGFAASHCNDTLIIGFVGGSELSDDFVGLGTSDSPFGGMLRFGGENYQFNAHRALFNYVYDSVELLVDATGAAENLVIKRLSNVGASESSPLLADHVRHDTREGKSSAQWQIELNTSNAKTYSGVIGETESNTVVKLNYTNNSSADIASSSDAGEICGTMQSGSSIELTYSAASGHAITSSGGNAGGLVGTMNGSSTLTVKAMPSVSLNAESASDYAGGLVGELTSEAAIDNQTGSRIPVSGSIKGFSGAGGLFGHYTNYTTEFDLANYNNTATADGTYCGGVFGVLENIKDASAASLSLTIKNTGNAGTLMANSGTTGAKSGYFGGIAGKYTTNALANSLILDNLTLTANANAAYSAFGGAIGTVDSAAYVKTVGTISVTAKGTTSSAYFGGLVGAASAGNGVFVDLDSFTLNTGNEQFKGGGLVGLFNRGVLRLSGTTTMTGAKPASAANCGQLVGNNDNVLVYAPTSGNWTFVRSSGAKTDDLGTWGEVVRGIDDSSSSNTVYFNSTAHTATIAAAKTSMGSTDDFIRTALNIQLNQGSGYDCLLFTSGSGNTRATLLASNSLSLSNDISLVGTGITGFMRDGGAVSDIGTFTGTFDGNDHSITLAIGEKYGSGVTSASTAEGVGQIYRHQHNGLFAVLAGTVKELTVTGTINVNNCVDGMNIGGIASRNGGNVTLTKVIANETVNYNESSKVTGTEAAGKNIGGYIGFVGTNGTITINGVSSIGATFNLSGSHESWNVYGGAIGKITAGSFTVNIGTAGDNNNKLTDSLTTSITGITAVGSNSDGGGLIGHIINVGSYSARQVNINNLAISGCTIGNAASTNGGGFLGYSWLNTTTNINGVTASGTINNSAAANVGVMLYSSTGKMVVNSLAINGLTMSSGGGASLGMIVNRAFAGETKDGKTTYSGGLYLDVLNSGYSLTCAAPSSAVGVFDEIAAYSAMNPSEVIKGGAGVISINMNATRNGTLVNINQTGTYQNRLKTGDACANSNSRYYYNIDKMSSSDGGQNLVLWSLSKYAYSGIKSEFGTSLNTTLSGTADLTGLSFYPLASANENYTIGNLTITFDYNGVRGTAEGLFGTANPTDSYVRDPAAANQHYLMHSGLFIDQPSGKSLTVTGTLSLGGTFMEDSSHLGVIISGTMKGTFLCNTGSIILDGIKPMNGASAYTSGYLLINNIRRTDDLAAPPSVTIKNLSNTDKYSSTTGSAYSASGTTDNVANSLIGSASGKGITIIFSKIKLDGRDKTKSDANLNAQELYNAYKTYNSIFSASTLLAEINTDQSAKLEYNFTKSDDWGTNTPREVTYGAEIKNSLEYVDEEQKYSPESGASNGEYVNPVNSTARSEVYDFAAGFLPYVKTPYSDTTDANGCFKRELKVNVQSVSLSSGCGTYNDPYLISDPKVFEAVAKFIASGDTNDLKEVVLPKTPDSDDIISGNRWHSGTDYHAAFKASGDDYVKGSYTWNGNNVRKYLASAYYMITDDIELTNSYVGLGLATENSNVTANGDYAFRGVIVGADVPDSDAENAPTHKARITNGSANPFINVSNGSVVKDLNITVSSNITLSQANAAYNNAFFGYYHLCKYYGGIFGEVMGGDNIIDNSYVTYSNSTITLSGSKGTIVPVGGYVGVVVFGGVIFKNMTATTSATSTELKVNNSGLNVKYTGKSENLADNDKQADWAAIYVNPIVGRVINGYAVNETTRFSTSENGKYHNDGGFNSGTARTGAELHTLKNGTKHYSIADINKNETNKLDVSAVPSSTSSDGTINIPNSQAFFILSLITQSCAGTSQGANTGYINSLSYGTNSTVYGMSRNADYTNVGTATENSDPDFALAGNDTTSNYATPYIIDRYCTNHNARCVTSTKGYYDINLNAKTIYSVDSYTYQLPDSFRGLGSVGYYDNADSNYYQNRYSVKVDLFDGKGCIIDEDIYLNRYRTDNYFSILHKGNAATQSVQSEVATYNVNQENLNHGIGLFDSIITRNANSNISNFTISGSVNTEIYKNGYNTSSQEDTIPANSEAKFLSVGGVVGECRGGLYLRFYQISLNNLSVCGSCVVGGILGYSGINSTSINVTLRQCSAEGLSVKMVSSSDQDNVEKSRNAIGGLIGKIFGGKAIIYGTSLEDSNNDLNNYSTVTIKAFEFQNPSATYRAAAGGLVGFAGDGCRVYDMKLQSSPNTNVTIGGNGVRFVGGLVGAMQSQASGGKTGVAVFKNSTVKEINLNGSFVGGFYGGKWDSHWTTYSITLDNCKLLGSSTAHNTIYANNVFNTGYAGGFVGKLYPYTNKDNNKVTHNVLIRDCSISNYDITAGTASQSYVGGFIGNASSDNDSVTCYIHDSSVENCLIGASGNYAGGIIGKIEQKNDNQLLGYNIKLNTISSNAGTKMGAWIGYAPDDTSSKKTSIQFAGLAIYGTGFTKNVGNSATLGTASFVFADYTGKCKGTETTDPVTNESTINYPTDISGFNYSSSTHVDMPKYPYININPQSDIGANETISGDGAVLYGSSVTGFNGKTADKTMAAKIYADLSDTSNTRRYTTFDKTVVIYDNKTIEDYLKVAPGTDGDKISTYRTEKGSLPTGVADFAVVVIANQTTDETTNLINSYIQLVTNTSTDYTASSDYYSINIQTCKFNGNDFVIDTSAANHGLTFSGGKFALNGSYADSNNNIDTFTLVDVQFKDPFDKSKIAYHLYVPVYTIKQIEVDFRSAVRTGTYSVKNNSETNDYSGLMTANGKHVDSLNTWITQYIRYSYKAEDINMLLSSNDLKWNNNKWVVFKTDATSTSFNRLPQNTYMILVDPNGNADREYYVENLNSFDTYYDSANSNKEGWIIDLSKFKDGSNNSFTVSNFNALIARSIIESTNGELLYTDGSASDYDVYKIQGDQIKYYKYANGNTAKYNLSVADDYVLNEDYYISMYIPNSADLYFYQIKAPSELTGAKIAKVNEKNIYTVIAADLYTQETSNRLTVAPDDQQINASNKTIYVNTSSSITINNAYARTYLNGVDLYHSFDLKLNRYSETEVLNDIIGLGNSDNTSRITATYSIGSPANENSSSVLKKDLQTNYLNIETAEIMSDLITASTNGQPLVVYSYIAMNFEESKLEAEFPQKNSEGTIGVNVSATSNLAYDENKLAYSSMSVPFAADSHYYYREAVNSAKLDYTAVTELDDSDNIGNMSQNQSRLGINGYKSNCYQQQYMQINTEAKYNVSAISEADLSKAEMLRLTISLSKKTDTIANGVVTGVEYVSVSDLLTYLNSSVLITSGSAYGTNGEGVTHTISANSSSLVVDIPIDQCAVEDNIYSIGVDLSAKTGTGFYEYANYMVTLRTELIYTDTKTNQEKAVENSGISDYVVYTNAKVFPTLITNAS
ncbi:MAG: hypothetical protein K6G33_07910 [Ruminococcus sp.]|uniref:beta strand repeat-containing protein n=1 Tax=Ruminococcus sp. TaxID=41978 RepID=UPI0025F36B3B|nr:hypothetical protein [Ruminococcus sp.]MCR5600649.1 hypothetical protein [Ruminococcus sp.]